MTLELAVRLAEIIIGVAIFQQSLEFIRCSQPEKTLGLVRSALAIVLMLGFYPLLIEATLIFTSVVLIRRFRGPYNGGSDTMTILVLSSLWLSHLAPSNYWQEMALGYLAIQLTLSYFQSGWVKVVNVDWRSGLALRQVFAFSAYPVSNQLRLLAERPALLFYMSWIVIIFELLFPLALLHHSTLIAALVIAGVFHLANAWLFGLNRFFWIWPAAYPIIIWFQARLIAVLQ